MSEALSLAGIREGAMNPPAGSAAAYEQMLLEQLTAEAQRQQSARTAERQAAMDRVWNRSGVGLLWDTLMPQSVGEVALGAAMGPGLSLGARTMLAALGGLTEASPAEGALLSVDRVRRLLRETPTRTLGRSQTEQGMGQLDEATRTVNNAQGNPLRFPAQYSADEVNQAFTDVAPSVYDTTRWLPMPDVQNNRLSWLYGLGPERLIWPTGNIMSGFRVGQVPRRLEGELDDALLYAGAPELRDLRLGYMPENNSMLGAYVPGENGLPDQAWIRAGQPPKEMNNSLYHELQHSLQRADRRPGGSSIQAAADRNPDRYGDYLQELLQLDPTIPAQDIDRRIRIAMYLNTPGEWEARVAGALSSGQAPANRLLELSAGTLPDFGLRGIR